MLNGTFGHIMCTLKRKRAFIDVPKKTKSFSIEVLLCRIFAPVLVEYRCFVDGLITRKYSNSCYLQVNRCSQKKKLQFIFPLTLIYRRLTNERLTLIFHRLCCDFIHIVNNAKRTSEVSKPACECEDGKIGDKFGIPLLDVQSDVQISQ